MKIPDELKLDFFKAVEKITTTMKNGWEWFIQNVAIALFLLLIIGSSLAGAIFISNAITNYFGQMPNEAKIAEYLESEPRYTLYDIEPENILLLEQECHQITGGNECSQAFEVAVEGRDKIVGTCIWGTRREKMVCTTE